MVANSRPFYPPSARWEIETLEAQVLALTAELAAAQRPPVSPEVREPEHPAHSGHEFGGGYARAAALAGGDPDWQNARGGTPSQPVYDEGMVERAAKAMQLHSGFEAEMWEGQNRESRDWWMAHARAALEAAQCPPVSKDDPIPRYAQLDVWMALFGAERSEEYEPFREEHGYAETWAWLLAQVRRPSVSPEVRDALTRALWEFRAGALTDDEWSVVRTGIEVKHFFGMADALLARWSVPSQPVYDEEMVERAAWSLYASECHRLGIVPVKQRHESGWSKSAWMKVARAALVAALRSGGLTMEEGDRG